MDIEERRKYDEIIRKTKGFLIFCIGIGAFYYFLDWNIKKIAADANAEANELMENGNFKGAIDVINDIYDQCADNEKVREKLDSNICKAYFGKGNKLFKDKNYEGAISAYRAMKSYSDDRYNEKKLNGKVGFCYAMLEPTKENTTLAIKYLKLGLAVDFKNSKLKLWLKRCKARMKAIPLNHKAIAAYKNGEHQRAAELFNKLIKSSILVKASKATPWYYLSQIALHQKKGKAALKYFKYSIEKESKADGMARKHNELRLELKKKFPSLF